MSHGELRHGEAARLATSRANRWEAASHRVLIAGGGVAALEALLALRALAGRRVDIDLLAPAREFVYRPLAVAEPFGRGAPRRFELAKIAAEHAAEHVFDALASVDAKRHEVRTRSGARIGYDSLLVAIGARPLEAIPGALTYRGAGDNEAFGSLLSDVAIGRVRRVAFAVPSKTAWPLALYELALLTASHLSRQASTAQLVVVTPETAPLNVLGAEASAMVGQLLDQAGVRLDTGSAPILAKPGRLVLASGEEILADRVVALPGLEVPPIPGLPQGPGGFISINKQMKVAGTTDVYAAGDATSFPLKQGGIAAQQADVAAAAIARRAGGRPDHVQYSPVLRAALLTGSTPRYFRVAAREHPTRPGQGERPLWWPPSKVAGRYLAPYLVAGTGGSGEPLADLEPVLGEDGDAGTDHTDAVHLALTAADADAHWGDYDAALRWLEVAEELDLVLSPAYEKKRRTWSRIEVE